MDYINRSRLVENKDPGAILPGCLSISASLGLGLLRVTKEVPKKKKIAVISLEF